QKGPPAASLSEAARHRNAGNAPHAFDKRVRFRTARQHVYQRKPAKCRGGHGRPRRLRCRLAELWRHDLRRGQQQQRHLRAALRFTNTKVGTEFRVNTYTTNDQLAPAVAMDAAGNFVVVWQSNNQGPTGSGYDIYGQRYNAAGSAVGNEFRVNTY